MKNDAIETISKGKYTAGLFQDIDYYADPRIDSDSPTRVYIFKTWKGDYSSDKGAEPVWMYHAEKRADQEYKKGNAEPLESFDSSYDYDLTNRLDQWSSDTGGVYLILGSRHNNGWSETDESDRHMIGVMYCEAENIVAEWGTNKQREAAKPSKHPRKPSKKAQSKALAYMRAEIDERNLICEGSVYGYEIEDNEGNEAGRCYGFVCTFKDFRREVEGIMDGMIASDECEDQEYALSIEPATMYP